MRREPEGLGVVSQCTQVIQLVGELEDVVKFVLDWCLFLLRVCGVGLVCFVVQNALFVQQKVLVDSAERLHGFVGAAAVDVGSCFFIRGELDEHDCVAIHACELLSALVFFLIV